MFPPPIVPPRRSSGDFDENGVPYGNEYNIPDGIEVPGLPDRIKPEDTVPLVLVPTDYLPPPYGDSCLANFLRDMKRCDITCGNAMSKMACQITARIAYAFCDWRGDKYQGPSDYNDTDFPTYTGF